MVGDGAAAALLVCWRSTGGLARLMRCDTLRVGAWHEGANAAWSDPPARCEEGREHSGGDCRGALIVCVWVS